MKNSLVEILNGNVSKINKKYRATEKAKIHASHGET